MRHKYHWYAYKTYKAVDSALWRLSRYVGYRVTPPYFLHKKAFHHNRAYVNAHFGAMRANLLCKFHNEHVCK